MTRDLPSGDLVDGLRRFCFHLLRYPNYGALTFTPAGLSPAEHASLTWTHLQTRNRQQTKKPLDRKTPIQVCKLSVPRTLRLRTEFRRPRCSILWPPQPASPLAHSKTIGSISDGSLSLTLPTRAKPADRPAPTTPRLPRPAREAGGRYPGERGAASLCRVADDAASPRWRQPTSSTVAYSA